jgi:hypothetical protein
MADDTAPTTGWTCAGCNEPAREPRLFGGKPYCDPDEDETCYRAAVLAQIERGRGAPRDPLRGRRIVDDATRTRLSARLRALLQAEIRQRVIATQRRDGVTVFKIAEDDLLDAITAAMETAVFGQPWEGS